MARRMSSRARLQKLQEEKAIEAEEKKTRADEEAAAKKITGGGRTRKKKTTAPPARMKVIWAVGEPGKAPKSTYPFPEREAAEAEAKRLTKKHGRDFLVKRDRVEM